MIDPRFLVQATRSVSVSYPIPFLFVTLLVFAIICLSGTALTEGLSQIAFVIARALSGLFAVLVLCYGLFVRTDLLRSEHHQVQTRLLDLAADKESPSVIRTTAMELSARKMPKRGAIASGDQEEEDV